MDTLISSRQQLYITGEKKMNVYRFNPEEFVDREQEVRQVIDEVITTPTKKKVVLLRGSRGAGKSWLMTRLFYALSAPDTISKILEPDQIKSLSKLKIKPFLIGMFPIHIQHSHGENNSIYATARDQGMGKDEIPLLLKRIVERFKVTRLQGLGNVLREQSRYLARDLSELSADEVPVFLVDSAFEVAEETRSELEKFLLSPILRSQRSLVIISGRGPTPIWSSPELRDPKIIDLQPFTEKQAQVSELLTKLKSPHLKSAALIYELSGGYPLTIRLLGKNDKQPLQSLDGIINSLLAESLPGVEGKKLILIRNYLERLSVIIDTAFRDREVAPILYSDKSEAEGLQRASEIRDILQRYSLVEYRNGGYIINPSILVPIKGYLKHNQSRQWINYYETALSRFNQLSVQYEKYPETKKYYQDLIKKINANNEHPAASSTQL